MTSGRRSAGGGTGSAERCSAGSRIFTRARARKQKRQAVTDVQAEVYGVTVISPPVSVGRELSDVDPDGFRPTGAGRGQLSQLGSV